MTTSWRRFLLYVGLSIGLLLFLLQVRASYEAVQQHEFLLFQPVYLLAALVLNVLVYVLQMFAWAMIMRYLGVLLSLHQTLQGYLLSFLPRYIPGSLWGYWSRSQWLEQSCGIDYATSILGSVLEALALILTSLIVSGMYLYTRLTGFRRFVLAGGCVGLLGLTWLIIPRLAARLSKERTQSYPRKSNPLRIWLAAIVLYIALWMTYGGSILLIGNAVLPTPSGNLLGTTFSSSLSWLLGFIVIVVPTGIGVRELTLSTLLSAHLSLPLWQANLVAVISRLEIILAELGWLMVGLILSANTWWRNLSQHRSLSRNEEE